MREIKVVRPLIRGLIIVTLGMLLSACSEGKVMEESNPSAAVPQASDTQQAIPPYSVETIASGLNVPWELAFVPDGRILFTERPGNLRVIEDGKLRDKPLLEFPAPFVSKGEGGLLGLALDPDFSNNSYAYVYHSYLTPENGVGNRVLRLKVGQESAVIDKVLIDAIPGDTNHNGGRIKFGPDGLLYITTGERYEPMLAQDKESLGGKILRIHQDGSIPDSNPWPGSPVYSWGHRNAQGLAWHPESGELYSSEHGQSSHDEINLITEGANYGWPLMEGDENISTEAAEMTPPLIHSGEETWAPSGMTFISQGPWKGQLLVSNLAGRQLLKVSLATDNGALSVESIFPQEWGRIRNVAEAPDGTLYVFTNNKDGRGSPEPEDDRLIALVPNAEVSKEKKK